MKKLITDNIFNDLVNRNFSAQFDNLSLSNETRSPIRKSESINESTPILTNDKSQLINNEYIIQQQVRPYFGRPGVNTQSIASHPDFQHLLSARGATFNQYICTVFIDIRGSTKLSLKYDLPFIYTFKNAVIQTCIELIRTFDGYVHRIMGDAILGFFGDSGTSKEEAVLDCLNCVSILNNTLTTVIQPWLANHKNDFDVNDFGFRIGCDFGDDDDVLWGNYGYGKTGEISPTGFPVDIAAKLQALSRKNQIMLGQNLLQYINFPNEFSNIQVRKKNGIQIKCPIVTPNYLNKNGQEINYAMRELDITKYLEGIPIDTGVKQSFSSRIINNPNIRIEAKVRHKNGLISNFHANRFLNTRITKVAQKGDVFGIDLQLNNNTQLLYPLVIKFIKVNHLGMCNDKELVETIHVEDIQVRTINFDNSRMHPKTFHSVSFERDCKYRGIHQVVCEVFNKNEKLIFRDIINVPIA